MALVSSQIVKAQENRIRVMMYDEHKTDREIIKELNLVPMTFYNYKRNIHDQDAHIWDKIHVDSTKFRATQLMDDLDRCRLECLKMTQDPNIGYRDKMEALKTSCEASANIFKLLNEGLSFNITVPIKHSNSDKPIEEDKPKEDRDIIEEETERPTNIEQQEPVPEHNNTVKTDTELIPSGDEPWGTSLQRPKSDYYEQNNKYHKTGIVKAKKQVEPSVSDPVSKSKKYSRL